MTIIYPFVFKRLLVISELNGQCFATGNAFPKNDRKRGTPQPTDCDRTEKKREETSMTDGFMIEEMMLSAIGAAPIHSAQRPMTACMSLEFLASSGPRNVLKHSRFMKSWRLFLNCGGARLAISAIGRQYPNQGSSRTGASFTTKQELGEK